MAVPGSTKPRQGESQVTSGKARAGKLPAFEYLKWLPILVCALPSLLLLAFVPPTFNQIDASTLLTSDLCFIVPHWPPLYPVFLFCNTRLFGLTDAGIYAIVIIQHVIAVSVAIYFSTAVSGTWRRLVMAIFVDIANYFFVFSHGIFTEALSTPFLLLFIGAATRLALLSDAELDGAITSLTLELFGKTASPTSRRFEITRRRAALFTSFVSLVLMTLGRHNMFIFAALLPGLYLMRILLMIKGHNLKPFAVSMLISLIAFMSVHLTNEVACKLIGTEATPLYGRVAVYRLHELPWDSMPSTEKVHLLSNMLRRCPDDFTRAAMLIEIRDKNPWMGAYKIIDRLPSSFRGQKTTDQALNDAAKAFFLTPNKYLVSDAISAFNQYMGEQNSTFSSLLKGSSESIIGYQTGKIDVPSNFHQIQMIKRIDPNQYNLITKIINPYWFDGCCRYIPLGILAIGLSVLAIARAGASRQPLAFVLVLGICAFLYAAISGALTVVVSRYLVPVNVAAWIMLGISIVSYQGLFERTARNSGTYNPTDFT